jgi:hypothetical protein
MELLDRLSEPHQAYQRADERARRVLNQVFFAKVYLDGDDDGPFLVSDVLADTLVACRR